MRIKFDLIYLNSFIISVKDSSIFTIPAFWNTNPVDNIPTRAGKVVRLISQPPKWAHILSSISWKSWPSGGAAVPPTIAYRVHQANPPMRPSVIILEHWRYVGKKGCGQYFCQKSGSQEGLSSSSEWHFTKNVYHQELKKKKKIKLIFIYWHQMFYNK